MVRSEPTPCPSGPSDTAVTTVPAAPASLDEPSSTSPVSRFHSENRQPLVPKRALKTMLKVRRSYSALTGA